MTAQEIRNAYLQFFNDRKHAVISRAGLVLHDDPTTLFTGSGMQPLMPYLLGESHPNGVRLVDSQTCLRAQDIDEIGDNRHTTFFEMLGNWSLGDYFKSEQLPWFFEFLVSVVGLNPEKLYVTCFIGDVDNDVPKDTESAEIWQKLFADKGIEANAADIGSESDGYSRGIKPGERIFYYDVSKNWWARNGMVPATMTPGEPGGPDSEVFYEFDFIEHDTKWGENCHPNCDCGRFMEIGNSVFMEYLKTEDGFKKLPKQNVDFGAGLERIAAASLDDADMFKISVIWPIIQKLEQISRKKYSEHTEAMRVIADHLRAATFLAVDGCAPSNKEQGYVMRRLLRRAIRFSFDLGVEQNFLQEVVPVIADLYHSDFPEVANNREDVIAVLVKEEKVFRQTLRKGLQQLERMFVVAAVRSAGGERSEPGEGGLQPSEAVAPEKGRAPSNHIEKDESAGSKLFTLYDTYGFPVELSVEECQKRGIELPVGWRQQFDDKMAEQRARSQTAAKGVFKGGLGGQTIQHKKYHTATHLMYQALRDVLGDHVVQHGSNITEERLRFDFSHPEKMTDEQKKRVEDIVNDQISRDLKVSFAEYPTPEATGPLGALGQFGDRYGNTVKVYKMIADGAEKPFSFEICGGPHVDHTLQLFEDNKRFKIIKEESSSAGIRRIKAVLQ